MTTRPRMVFDSPCDADLDSMPSFDGGRRRFCSECMRSVHMLSEMTRAEAQAFVDANKGECMSYRRGADGRLVFRTEPADEAGAEARAFVPRDRLTRRLPRAAAAAPVLAALAGCTSPPEAPQIIEDEQAELEVDTEAAFASYRAVPEQAPCDPPPADDPEPEHHRGNNEILDGTALPKLGNPGHYAGGMAVSDIELPKEVSHSLADMRLASVEVRGGDEAVTRRVLRQRTAQVRACLEDAKVDPSAGELELDLVIDATGRVLTSKAKLSGGASAGCVAERAEAWTFPEPDSPSATVRARFKLTS